MTKREKWLAAAMLLLLGYQSLVIHAQRRTIEKQSWELADQLRELLDTQYRCMLGHEQQKIKFNPTR
jgi:hypothetical protein